MSSATKARFDITYPESLSELDTGGNIVTIKQNAFSGDVQITADNQSTTFVVTFSTKHREHSIPDETKHLLANRALELLNRCIRQVRTFHYKKTNFLLLSPRFINKVKATFIEENNVVEEVISVKRDMPKYLYEFLDVLNSDDLYPNIEEKLELEQVPFIHLITDAYYSFLDGNYNECVINCATAVESFIFPELQQWLTKCLYHQNPKSAEKILMEIPMSLKYELFFGTIEKEHLKSHNQLLEDLKKMNRLRNSIIHSACNATKKDAENTLDQCGKLFCIAYNKMDDLDY